jgi:hypothetical protein
MSMHAAAARLSGLALVLACGHHPAPVPDAEVAGIPDCPKPDTLSHRGGGIALGPDIYRGPRYRVDSAGRVETLPPVPGAGADTARPGCRTTTDTSDSSSR